MSGARLLAGGRAWELRDLNLSVENVCRGMAQLGVAARDLQGQTQSLGASMELLQVNVQLFRRIRYDLRHQRRTELRARLRAQGRRKYRG